MARRLSGLQKDVLRLYRRSLKLVASKPLETRHHWFQFVSHQFRSAELGGGLKKRDTASIEYMLRRGTKMLEQYESKGVRDVNLPQSDKRWEEGWVAKGGKQQQQQEREGQ